MNVWGENIKERIQGLNKQTKELIDQVYRQGYKAGQENALTVDSNRFIEQGRNEALEAIKKIYLPVDMGGLPGDEIKKIFDELSWYNIVTKFSASEIVEKLRAYEEQKKQKEDIEIHIGDEVVWTVDNCDSGIVTKIESSENAMWIIKPDGLQICASKCKLWKKTGRTFPEIAEFLKKMQEGEE